MSGPFQPPHHGFNPHGISARPEINLMVTSDFIMPASTLDTFLGDLELRGSIRVWNFRKREVLSSIHIPSAIGTMDVKLIPGDPEARAFTAGMFDGLVYLVNTKNGTYAPCLTARISSRTSKPRRPGAWCSYWQCREAETVFFSHPFRLDRLACLTSAILNIRFRQES